MDSDFKYDLKSLNQKVKDVLTILKRKELLLTKKKLIDENKIFDEIDSDLR